MPHAPPPENLNELDTPSLIIAALVAALPFLFYEYFVVSPIITLLGVESRTDVYVVAFVMFLLAVIGTVSEVNSWWQHYPIQLGKTYLAALLISLATFGYFYFQNDTFHFEYRGEPRQVSSISVRILMCFWVAFVIAGQLFALNWFQVTILRLRSMRQANKEVLDQQRTVPIVGAMPQPQPAPLSQNDLDVEWSIFDDPDALQAVADSRLRKARETNDPKAAEKYTAEAQLLLSKMDELHRLPKPAKRLMLEDKRAEDK